jgi:hypothetical protein
MFFNKRLEAIITGFGILLCRLIEQFMQNLENEV